MRTQGDSMPPPPELPLLASLIVLLLVVFIVKWTKSGRGGGGGGGKTELRIPPRNGIVLVAMLACEVLYVDWLSARFKDTPMLCMLVRIVLVNIIMMLMTARLLRKESIPPSLTYPPIWTWHHPTRAIMICVLVGLIWGIDEMLACKTCTHNVQASTGCIGLALVAIWRLVKERVGTHSSSTLRLVFLILVAIPLTCIGSFLTMPFSFIDGFAVSTGIIRALRFIVIDIFILSLGASLTSKEPYLITTVDVVASNYQLLLIASLVSAMLCLVGFLLFELPLIVAGTRNLDMLHPIELIMLTIPGAALSLGTSFAALDFLRVSSTTAVLSCSSIANFVLLWILLGKGLSYGQCVAVFDTSLILKFIGLKLGVVGCVMQWRGEPSSANGEDDNVAILAKDNNVRSGEGVDVATSDLGTDEIFDALDSLPAPKALDDETSWLLRDE